MQVPPAWASLYGRTTREALDPCINIALGTAMLSEFDASCLVGSRAAGAPAGARRACVLRHYAAALGEPELVTVVTMELRLHRTANLADPASAVPIFFAPPGDRTWGPDRILVVLEPRP